MNTNQNYRICEAATSNVLVAKIELPSDRVENLSADSAEGFFRADQIDELSELGEVTVYAILL